MSPTPPNGTMVPISKPVPFLRRKLTSNAALYCGRPTPNACPKSCAYVSEDTKLKASLAFHVRPAVYVRAVAGNGGALCEKLTPPVICTRELTGMVLHTPAALESDARP